jgi:hypothetical protein
MGSFGSQHNLRRTGFASPEDQALVLTNRLCWAITIALSTIISGIVLVTPLRFVTSAIPMGVIVVFWCLVIAVTYTFVMRNVIIASIANGLALLGAFSFILTVYSYGTTYLGAGISSWDAYFAAADAAFGLNWIEFLFWLNDRPTLTKLLNTAYLSIFAQAIVLVPILVVRGEYKRLYTSILAFQISGIACVTFAGIVPAIGAYDYFKITAATHHPDIVLATMDSHVQDVLRLRSNLPVIPLDNLQGILVFPSFHAALAILLAWAFWCVPVARWVGLLINTMMLVATPISGGHYFVDIPAGILIAVLAITLSRSWWKSLAQRAEEPILTQARISRRQT